jgi:tRNA A37 threonylcarbamoyladenosine modification protein TsaB
MFWDTIKSLQSGKPILGISAGAKLISKNSMNLKLILKNSRITVELRNNQKIIDSINLENANNLSKILLVNIDLILRRNKLGKNQIEKVSVKSDIPDSYTSNRIVKSLEKSFGFALKGK